MYLVFVSSDLVVLLRTSDASNYTFTKIADSNCQEFFCGLSTNFGVHPAINNKGAVAFFVSQSGDLDRVDSIIVAHRKSFVTIADTTNPLFFLGGLRGADTILSLNDAGTVVFEAVSQKGGTAVELFTGDGRTLTSVAQSEGAGFMANTASINNAGTVAFALMSAVENAIKIVRRNGTTSTIMDDTGSYKVFMPPSINDRGTAAFRADNAIFEIVASDGRMTTTIAEASDPFTGFSPFPKINNRGTVVFSANLVGGGTGVFIGDGHSIITIADSSGPFAYFDTGGNPEADSPSINDRGEVAFTAGLGGEEDKGIFTGPDPVADKVITTGDFLFGSEVTYLTSGREGLNNKGQIVFWAKLADGTRGIYRADKHSGL
jgi:hypothetical protein